MLSIVKRMHTLWEAKVWPGMVDAQQQEVFCMPARPRLMLSGLSWQHSGLCHAEPSVHLTESLLEYTLTGGVNPNLGLMVR